MSCVVNCTACSVIAENEGWFVEVGPSRRGPYRSTDMALRIAYREAALMRWNGQAARISVRNNNDNVVAEYCLCPRATFN